MPESGDPEQDRISFLRQQKLIERYTPRKPGVFKYTVAAIWWAIMGGFVGTVALCYFGDTAARIGMYIGVIVGLPLGSVLPPRGEFTKELAKLSEGSEHLVFDFAPKIVGVTALGQIVTLLKFIEGDGPTQEEADEFLRELRFEPVKQSCFLWKRAAPDDGFEYWIGDARDENFVKTARDMVPIDLRMWAVDIGAAQ